jgi:Nuclear transport factor 2 (NTF2) domain
MHSAPSTAPPQDSIAIADLSQPVISEYFATLNAGDFQATAALFADDGALQPPFETPIVGAEAIAAYLSAEAKGFVLQPQQVTAQPLADGSTELQVGGRVQTPLFSVHVGWRFVLNSQQEICFLRVKLLASLEELVRLRR